MVANQNNTYINSFTKGMNTDTSLDMIGNELYVFGLNIRITSNALLGALIDSNNKEGVVTPVPSGISISTGMTNYTRVLATASIENVGVVIVKDASNYWHAFRVDCRDILEFKPIFHSSYTTDKNKFSIVMNKELNNITKVYIADGVNEIMMINLDDLDYYQNMQSESEEVLTSNKIYPIEQLSINKVIPGKLKTQQVQYTYRFYKKHGICSRPAPLTNKILVIDGNRNREQGNAEDTETTIGFQLYIPCNDRYNNIFDHIQVYRLSYLKPNVDAQINLIYDAKISMIDHTIRINDTGLDSLQELSTEEFAALTDLNIIPLCIEQNLNYLFSANTTDNTMLKLSDSNIKQEDLYTYSSTEDGRYILYKDQTYIQSMEYRSINDVDKRYYLNKYVDMNVGDEVRSSDICRYIVLSNKVLIGGISDYISWNLVSTRIPLHTGFKSNDYKYQEIPNVEKKVVDNQIYNLTLQDTTFIDSPSGQTVKQYLKQHHIYDPEEHTYNNMITSSMFRSLKRDETYRYGIIFYDEYGRRTNVYWIADIRTPNEAEYSSTILTNETLYARPIGVRFNVNLLKLGFASYQIVRCTKNSQYSKNLLLCVLSRPIRQPLVNTTGVYKEPISTDDTEIKEFNNDSENVSGQQYSPYYPQQFLTTNYYKYRSFMDDNYYLGHASSFDNDKLFLIFNPQINVQRNDLLQLLSKKELIINPVQYLYGNALSVDLDRILDFGYYLQIHLSDMHRLDADDDDKYINYYYYANLTFPFRDANFDIFRHINDASAVYKKYKQQTANVMYDYNRCNINGNKVDIKNVADVLNPKWEDGWSNLSMDPKDAAYVADGTKTYKGFTSNIGNFSYVNWVCSNLYDLQIGSVSDHKDGDRSLSVYDLDTTSLLESESELKRRMYANGAQGPGPVCFLIELSDSKYPFNESVKIDSALLDSFHTSKLANGTLLCNIQHSPVQFAGLTKEEKQYDSYYGFGNVTTEKEYTVFDGDVYITPCEIVTMFKTYDFQSKYSLLSNQFVYYVPMETIINTYFDYGMNYMNTQNKNLQLEPGDITGVSVQDRPLNQYNMIYSLNNISNDVYNTESLETSEDTFTQRIHYSQLKTNGESIDNWLDFKAIDYIDTDTRYGLITNLLTSKDVLYFWLTQAFGRLSVNERSLVTDNNDNTIQLGQGGVLQRTDYIDTKHGMREQDFSALSAEGLVFWIDMVNKAVIQSDGQKTVNYSEHTNVLNIVNRAINVSVLPKIDYDILNNELLCRFLQDKMQLVFNIKMNTATSVYTRDYDNTILFNNVLYGLTDKFDKYDQYNYLNETSSYLTPTELSFVVNPNSSTTKVFDNQEVVTLNRGLFINDNHFMKDKTYKFNTNLYTDINIQPEGSTDREGNIRYAIPRTNNQNYGNRMRGKWMLVNIVDNNPRYEQSISHIITNFRQSFS